MYFLGHPVHPSRAYGSNDSVAGQVSWRCSRRRMMYAGR